MGGGVYPVWIYEVTWGIPGYSYMRVATTGGWSPPKPAPPHPHAQAVGTWEFQPCRVRGMEAKVGERGGKAVVNKTAKLGETSR